MARAMPCTAIHLNTPRKITAANGTLLREWDYSGFGRMSPTTANKRFAGPTTHNLRYPG